MTDVEEAEEGEGEAHSIPIFFAAAVAVGHSFLYPLCSIVPPKCQ